MTDDHKETVQKYIEDLAGRPDIETPNRLLSDLRETLEGLNNELAALLYAQRRIVEFLSYYQDEGQPGDVVRAQMSKAIIGIIKGEEVA